ncbi:hypothetical protein BaRGS_00032960, partial [Batillaria attramentaria]
AVLRKTDAACTESDVQACYTGINTNIGAICGTPLTGSDKDTGCSTVKNALDNCDAGYDTCAAPISTAVTTSRTGAHKAYDLTCGAAQFLMSWPLYIAVLVVTIKQFLNSSQ